MFPVLHRVLPILVLCCSHGSPCCFLSYLVRSSVSICTCLIPHFLLCLLSPHIILHLIVPPPCFFVSWCFLSRCFPSFSSVTCLVILLFSSHHSCTLSWFSLFLKKVLTSAMSCAVKKSMILWPLGFLCPTLHPPCHLSPPLFLPTWPFRSPPMTTFLLISAPLISWSTSVQNWSFMASSHPILGAWALMTITCVLPMFSFTLITLSHLLCTSTSESLMFFDNTVPTTFLPVLPP